MNQDDIDPEAVPSGDGCAECEASGGWWFHLRRCAACGRIGCCDSSLGQHATAHARATGHTVIASFEPGEEWFFSYDTGQMTNAGPVLADPGAHPVEQQTPGPAARVPADWEAQLARAGRV